MSGVGIHKFLKKLVHENVELVKYLYIMAQVEDGELKFVKAEKFPPKKKKEEEKEEETEDKEPDEYEKWKLDMEAVTTLVQDPNETPEEAFLRMKVILLQEKACFMIYNFYYGHQNKSGKFFLIRWIDDNCASVRTKMTYASSSNGLTAKMPNLAPNVIQCCDPDEVTYESFKATIKSAAK